MTDKPYLLDYKLLSSDSDCRRRLRLSRLFTLLQEAAIAHTEELGFGRTRTLDRGLLWVLLLQQVKITRLPEYDERIRLCSVPGPTMHSLYLRDYRMTDSQGRELLRAAALWTLMDAERRTMTDPEQTGVLIAPMEADWERFFPKAPRGPKEGELLEWTVPYSHTDLNGHMNNARYLDLAEDLMSPALRDRAIREIQVEYAAEARLGETLRLRREALADRFRLSCERERRLFRAELRYDSETGEEHGV